MESLSGYGYRRTHTEDSIQDHTINLQVKSYDIPENSLLFRRMPYFECIKALLLAKNSTQITKFWWELDMQ